MTEHLTPNPCSNCGDPVVRRRPTTTGKSWCSRGPCQAAKQRFYRSTKADRDRDKVEAKIRHNLTVALFGAALHDERVTCGECGREDALDGWVHPLPLWAGPCTGTGIAGQEEYLLELYAKIWPQGAPF